MKTWEEIGFRKEITSDGSPSLRGLSAESEAMHHSGGALSETLLIYGEPLKEVFSQIARPRIFSLGLGLAYVEMVTAALALRAGKDFELITMESEEGLSNTARAYFDPSRGFEAVIENDREADLQGVLEGIAKALEQDPAQVHQSLSRALRDGRWLLRGALGPDSIPTERFHGILYDAFSSKTSPALWSEEFLGRFLSECTEPDAMLSTYACTGNLKRSLKNAGFELILREGFMGKRSATLGRRGIFSALPYSGTYSRIQ